MIKKKNKKKIERKQNKMAPSLLIKLKQEKGIMIGKRKSTGWRDHLPEEHLWVLEPGKGSI